MSLKGKTALVTGSSRGLGKAIALEFAAKGAKVAINYRASEGEANEVVKEIKAMGGEVGASLVEEDLLELAKNTVEGAKIMGVKKGATTRVPFDFAQGTPVVSKNPIWPLHPNPL